MVKPAVINLVDDNFGRMWHNCVNAIMSKGINRMSTNDETGTMTKDAYLTTVTYGDGIKQIRELAVHPQYPMGIGGLTAYCNEFTYEFVEEQKTKTAIEQFDYTYMDRFTSGSVDQLKHMHALLRDHGIIRRNQIITWNIEKDHDSPVPPCIQHLQVREIETGIVDIHLMARSRDIFGAYPANQCGILKMLDEYVFCGDYEVNMITDVSNCAHIYKHNWDEATALKTITPPTVQTFRGVTYRGR